MAKRDEPRRWGGSRGAPRRHVMVGVGLRGRCPLCHADEIAGSSSGRWHLAQSLPANSGKPAGMPLAVFPEICGCTS